MTGSREIRLLEVTSFRINHSFDVDESLVILKDASIVYGSEIPKEQLEKTENDILVNAFHYFRDVYRPFGIPFKFLLRQVI